MNELKRIQFNCLCALVFIIAIWRINTDSVWISEKTTWAFTCGLYAAALIRNNER